MYKVYCDEHLIFHTQMENIRIFNPKLDVATNKTGSFTFTIYPTNPYYDKLNKLKSIIKVYQNDDLIFRGRILDDDSYFHNEKKVVCEGELAFFLDTIQEDITNITNTGDLVASLINKHNEQVEEEKRFNIGNIDTELLKETMIDESSNFLNTWEIINKELLEKHGGYIWVRHEGKERYIDYISDFKVKSNQPVIEFGKNLLDFSRKNKGSNIATAIIPLGKNRLDIKGVNGGINYLVDEDSKSKYGFICKVVEFSEITSANDLMIKGQQYLDELKKPIVSLEVSAIDLAHLSNDFTSFRLGTYVEVKSKPHNVDTMFLVNKLSIDLLNPKANKLILGKTYSTFTEQSSTKAETQKQITNAVQGIQVQGVTTEQLDDAIRQTDELTSSNISQSADEIYAKVSQDFYLKDDAEALVESINTELIQTNEAFEMRFNQYNADIEDLANNTDIQFQEINKYIKFVDGNIILGQEGNDLTLKIENKEIGFYHEGTKVAYFSNNKLHVLDGEFIQSLKLGKFAWLPRTNNNLTFKKVEK